MLGVWLEDKQISLRNNLTIPPNPRDEVCVKVLRAGICNTDLELIKGYYPYTGVLGHEFVGRVVDSNAPESLQDQIVVGEINASCHSCEFCHQNLPNHCSNRTVMGIINRWGCMAEYVTLPRENLHIVPHGIPPKEACFVEPLAAALQPQQQYEFLPHHKVLVIGGGKLGQLICRGLAVNTTSQLTLLDKNRKKLDLLAKDFPQFVLEVDNSKILPDSFDVVIECSGHPDALSLAVDSLKPQGTLIMKSTHASSTPVNTAPIVVKELNLIGSRCGPFDKALDLLKNHSNQLRLGELIDFEVPLVDAIQAFEAASLPGTMKVQLVME